MGNCLGNGDGDIQIVPTNSGEYQDSNRGVAMGGNKPLKQSAVRWTHDGPINEAQLKIMREEFWDTAPKFEGRQEIWQALRGAVEAFEQGEYDLAQAIATGAEISTPNGSLAQCYDTLGTHYSVPKYCLASPTNLLQMETTEIEESTDSGSHAGAVGGVTSESETLIKAVEIKIRLPSKDVKVKVNEKATVRELKKELSRQEGIEPQKIRFLFSGKFVKDEDSLEDLKIPKGFVIQGFVSS